MAKPLIPVSVRIVTEAAVIDGSFMAPHGDFWDVWNIARTGLWMGRRVYQATVYPRSAGAAPIASPVVAVNNDTIVAVVLTDQAAMPAALQRAAKLDRRVGATVLTDRLTLSGTMCTFTAMLENDGDVRENPLTSSAVFLDATLRSLDPGYPFEMAAPFVVLGEIAPDSIIRTG